MRRLAIHEEIRELEAEMASLIEQSGHTVQTASGCGIVQAATLIGEIGDIAKFRSPASLAKYAVARRESVHPARRAAIAKRDRATGV
jgi:transposase